MRIRLILSFVLVALISIISVVLFTRLKAASEVRAFMFRGSMTGVDDLVNNLEAYYQTYQSWQGVASLFAGFGRGQGQGHGMGNMTGMMNQRLRLADDQGFVLFDTNGVEATGMLSEDERQASILLRANGQIVGYLLPQGGMGFNRNDELFLMDRLNQAALTAIIIGVGLSLALALLLADRLLRPVQELTVAAEKMASGDLSQRVPLRGKDELTVLGQTFNRMAGSLEQARESRQAMTADIAHELRNPLAVQRAHLEALQDGIYLPTVENLQPILDQNLMLTHLVEDLRTLALADSGQLNLERTYTDFPELVNRVVERSKPQATSHDVTIQIVASPETTSPPSRVFIDPLRVDQILSNLLSNALRYTPQGSKIDLGLSFSKEIVQVTIHDDGPGIPPEALPYIFERFYRADHARSRLEGGSGLGLAIARHLAEAHGGMLSAANHPQGGAIFTLTLPVSQGARGQNAGNKA